MKFILFYTMKTRLSSSCCQLFLSNRHPWGCWALPPEHSAPHAIVSLLFRLQTTGIQRMWNSHLRGQSLCSAVSTHGLHSAGSRWSTAILSRNPLVRRHEAALCVCCSTWSTRKHPCYSVPICESWIRKSRWLDRRNAMSIRQTLLPRWWRPCRKWQVCPEGQVPALYF